jgi:hypothetical protein
MTPQENDLITALLNRLKQAAGQPKDAEAEALIRRGMAEQPDAPYLLVQTVLIQDMALGNAQHRIAELERQLAEAKSAPPPQPAQPTSFLGGAMRGSVPAAGPWGQAAQAAPHAPASGPVWTQSGAAPAASQPAMAPLAAPGASSGFLRQAATTAAGIAGGALLFQGIQSLFGPHYGNFLGGMPMQPGLGETVINNYYGDQGGNAPDTQTADYAGDQTPDQGFGNDPGYVQADDSQADTSSDFGGDDQDFGSDQDFGGGDDIDV